MTTLHYILVADDDATIRRFLVRAANRVAPDVPVIEAVNGQEALQMVQHYQLRLVITDYHMPGATGLHVVELARAHDPLLPIVVISAHQHVADAVLKAGANVFLPKPVMIDHLLATLQAVLGLS